MPKYLVTVFANEASEAGAPPDPELIVKMGALMEEGTKAGVLLATDGLKPSSQGKRLIADQGQVRVVDGPFTESKELIASYALLQCRDMEETVYWTTKFLNCIGSGTCEIRPIFEFTDFPSDIFPPEEVSKEVVLREQMARNAQQ